MNLFTKTAQSVKKSIKDKKDKSIQSTKNYIDTKKNQAIQSTKHFVKTNKEFHQFSVIFGAGFLVDAFFYSIF